MGESRYKHCIVAGGDRYVSIWRSRVAIQHCDMAAECRDTAYNTSRLLATRRAMRTAGVGSRYSFCIVIGGSSPHGIMRARQGLRHRQYVLRHGQARPRHGACAATTRLRERRARGLFAQPGPWVCALCTRPSFDLVHCYESLFGSLFMNIVHEVFKKK